jgi:predicted ATPase
MVWPASEDIAGLPFPSPLIFLVGKNGSGKSTLLEAIAECCVFKPEGGSHPHRRPADAEPSDLASALRLARLPRVRNGVSTLDLSRGRSFQIQSHGDSFLVLFTNRCSQGLVLLDEPEAALSPKRQLACPAATLFTFSGEGI